MLASVKSQKRVFGALTVLAVLGFVAGDNFCTPGVRASCGHPSACIDIKCGDLNSYGRTDFRNKMLNAHNAHRKNSTLGKFGADMIKMEWSRELEDNALKWIQNLCRSKTFRADESQCRKTTSFDSVGQNLWTGSGPAFGDMKTAAKTALNSWYLEKKSVTDQGMILAFGRKPNEAISHYTQMMWAKSFMVGCAYVRIPTHDRGFKAFIACNYAQAGNMVNQPVFNANGSLASKCRPGTRKGASGLCEVVDEVALRASIGLGRTG